MKKIVLILFALFFCLTNSQAQTSAKIRDSLKVLIQKEKQDTSRVLLLDQLAFAMYESKPDTAILLELEALSLSRRIGFVKGEAVSLSRMGTIYIVLGNSTKSMELFVQAQKLNEKMNSPAGIAESLNNIGGIYKNQGQYRQAIGYYSKAKTIIDKLDLKKEIARSFNNLGQCYLQLNQYDSARVYVQQAYEVASKINYHRQTGFALNSMGNIFSRTGQTKLALEYYRLSIHFCKLSENNLTLAWTYLGMASLFKKDGQLDSSLYYANQAFRTSWHSGGGARMPSSFLYSFYKEKGNADSALFYLELVKTANDSIFSRERSNQLQSMIYDEKSRQQTIEEERKHNLQFTALAIGLITFIILFFALSRSIIVKTKFIEFFGILGLLALFEFINLFIHPYLDKATNHSPVFMLLVLIVIGALLIPLHHKLEKWMTHVMVEKNKKIRLEAAERTIAELAVKPNN